MSAGWLVLTHLAAFLAGIGMTLLTQRGWRAFRRIIDRGDITW